ncbi:unnamed protein product [Soboliphyme baturini]|uniref:KAT8 regulatory NSL complex subunit 2 n=1 Tax=Soboliphyme baturini TaxID=241478 RepID=A0A183IJJ8_9BILA|nr:unnamed protein product [Soboliphyme baturini]
MVWAVASEERFCPIHAKKVVKIRRIARRAKLKKTTVDSLVGASLDLLKGGDCIPNIPVVAASQSLVVGDEASEDSIDDDDEEERIVEMDGTVEDGDAEQDDSDDPLRSDDQYEPVVVQCTVDGCKKRVLPKTSYCRRHILRDSRQCLYVPCIFSGCDNAVYKFAETKLCLGHYMYAPKMTKRMTNVENEARVVSEGEEEVKCKDETETNRDESVQVAEVCNEVNVEVQEESQP